MYDSASISRLMEKLDYEQWVIVRSLEVLDLYQGQSSRSIVFMNNQYQTHVLALSDSFGASKQAEFIMDSSPLIFGASFKVLDMIMEWIVEENNQVINDSTFRSLWAFQSKIAYLNKHMGRVTLPYPFNSAPDLFVVLFGLYANMSAFRNKLVHGKWGKNRDGNLEFDFEHRGNRVQKVISFNEISRFAECVVLCTKEITQHSFMSDKIIETIKWNLDGLIPLHQGKCFNTSAPVYMDVICKYKEDASATIKVDLTKVREYLDCDSLGYPYKFTLHIELETSSLNKKWVIPSNSLSTASTELILDSNWDGYLV